MKVDSGSFRCADEMGRKYEDGGFGPITAAPEYSDISDSEQDPPNNYGDEGLSDTLSSDCERPIPPTEPLFTDDEEEEQRKREEAERYEQMRREKEERRQKAIARKAEKEAKAAAASSSTGEGKKQGGKKLIGAHRDRFSRFTAAPPPESELDVPNVPKQDLRNSGITGGPNGPVILTPTKARWGVPVEAETVPEKDNRLQNYCVAAAEAEKFSVSEDPRPPSTVNNASVPSTFMEPAVDDSIGPQERKRGPPPTYSTLNYNRQTVSPPPAIGSTGHETTINHTNVGVQSNTTEYEMCTDPSKLGALRDVFISYISFHVYCNRSTEGITMRTWSRISKGLDASLRAPELYMGREWTEELERAIPNLTVVPIRGDLLFDWNDEPLGAASRRSSIFRF